jgi:hypothetical protein
MRSWKPSCQKMRIESEGDPPRTGVLAPTLACGAILAIVLAAIVAHFGLAGIGQWAYDDFAIISSYRDTGWSAFGERVLHWSPRPISEILIWMYAWIVIWARKPLIGPMLGFLWLTLLSAPLVAFAQIPRTNRGPSRRRLTFMALFGSGLLALFLLEHSPGTLFYTPSVSAAYLTTLSAITLCFFQLAFNLTENHLGRIIGAVAMIIAAGSSEVGASFAVIFGSVSLIFFAVEKLRCGSHQRPLGWYLVPVSVGGSVLCLLVLNRAHRQEALFSSVEYHNIFMSLKTAAARFIAEFLTTGQRLSIRGILFSLSIKACFFISARYCCLSSGVRVAQKQTLLILALSIGGTTYFSVAASYYGYGGLTNPWHQELRQCLIVLFIATMAVLSCYWRAPNLSLERCEWIASIAFAAALLAVLPSRVPALIHDYKQYAVCAERRRRSWRSGFADGNRMIWWCPPRGRVADTLVYTPGVYDLQSRAPGVLDIMHFFDKQHLEIRGWTGSGRSPGN